MVRLACAAAAARAGPGAGRAAMPPPADRIAVRLEFTPSAAHFRDSGRQGAAVTGFNEPRSPAANRGAPDVLLQFDAKAWRTSSPMCARRLSRTGFTAIMALFSSPCCRPGARRRGSASSPRGSWIRIRLENAWRCRRLNAAVAHGLSPAGGDPHGRFRLQYLSPLAWSPGEPIGMVLATAWCAALPIICSCISAPTGCCLHRAWPLALTSIAAPFTTAHFDLATAVAVATLVCLIVAAGMFVRPPASLGNLAKQAAAARAVAEKPTPPSRNSDHHEPRTAHAAQRRHRHAELIEEEADTDRSRRTLSRSALCAAAAQRHRHSRPVEA